MDDERNSNDRDNSHRSAALDEEVAVKWRACESRSCHQGLEGSGVLVCQRLRNAYHEDLLDAGGFFADDLGAAKLEGIVDAVKLLLMLSSHSVWKANV